MTLPKIRYRPDDVVVWVHHALEKHDPEALKTPEPKKKRRRMRKPSSLEERLSKLERRVASLGSVPRKAKVKEAAPPKPSFLDEVQVKCKSCQHLDAHQGMFEPEIGCKKGVFNSTPASYFVPRGGGGMIAGELKEVLGGCKEFEQGGAE